MATPLSHVPGLGGFLAAQQQQDQQEMMELQRAATLGALLDKARAAQQQQAFRSAMAGATTPEQQQAVAARYASPEHILQSGDRQAAIAATRESAAAREATQRDLAASREALQRELAVGREATTRELAAARMEAQQRHEQMQHQFNMLRAQNDAERRAETARHNRASEATQAQLAALQAEQRQRVESDKEDKVVEQAIGKTQTQMKDLVPAITAAREVNSALSQYTPETVPGVGYLKNTDWGKVFLSDEGKLVSSKIKLFGNAVLKALSGTAVTAPEEIRQMAAQMADGRFSAQDFYAAWPTLAKWINDQMALGTAALTPRAREVFTGRTGLDLSPITPRFTVEDGRLKETKASTGGSLPPKNSKGWNLMIDAKGNRAYVGPNNEIEEVR